MFGRCLVDASSSIGNRRSWLCRPAGRDGTQGSLRQLLAYWDQRSASKGEGASGSDMARKSAGLDCDNRRYADGIKRMEDLLRQNRYPVPPPQP